jgi:hypothetical protein
VRLLELNYAERYETKVSELKALELLRERCRNAHATAKTVPIFKKLKLDGPYYVIQPAEADAKPSKFLVEGLITSLSGWSRYPNRALSVKGHTDHSRAESRGEGEMYLVLPFDGAKIAVTSGATFIRSFDHAAKWLEVAKVDNAGMLEWLESMERASNEVGADIKLSTMLTPVSFFKQLEKLEVIKGPAVKKKLQAVETGESCGDLDVRRASNFADRTSSPTAFFNAMFDPEDNGFHLLSTSSTFPQDREVWTGSKCLMILASKYDELHKRGDVR